MMVCSLCSLFCMFSLEPMDIIGRKTKGTFFFFAVNYVHVCRLGFLRVQLFIGFIYSCVRKYFRGVKYTYIYIYTVISK